MNLFYGILGASWYLLIIAFIFYKTTNSILSNTNEMEEL